MKKRIFKALALFLVLTLVCPAAGIRAKTVKPALSKTSLTLELGNGTKKLKILNFEEGSTVVWSVSGKKRLELVEGKNGKGVTLFPKSTGNAKVTCVVVTPAKKAYTLECQVKIKPLNVPAKSVKITNGIIDDTYNAHLLTEGESYKFETSLTSSIAGKEATDKVYWVSSDKSVAKVSKNGKVTAVGSGTAKITAYAGKTKKAALAAKVKKTIRVHVDASAAKVEKVELEHSRLLKIYFNKEMESDSIYNLSTSELLSSAVVIQPEKDSGIEAMNPGTLKASLSSDGKELFIEAENGFSGTYGITVTQKVTTKKGDALSESYYEKAVLKDTKAPVIKDINTDESGTTCVVTFSEPIDISHLTVKDPAKADGTPIYSTNGIKLLTTASNYVLSKNKTQISIDMSSLTEQDLNCEIKVNMSGIVDMVNNAAADDAGKAYITVSLFTNTLNKKEAECKTVKRNGNSIAAEFDQPIYIPGIAIVDSKTTLTGKVNPDNKKEVIYSIVGSGLEEKTGLLSVKVTGFSVFANNTKATEFTSNVNFGSSKIPTVPAASSFTTKTVNGVGEKILTIEFTNSVTPVLSSGSISATRTADGTVSAAKDYPYSVSVDGKVMTFIIDGNFEEQGQYNFSLPAGFFKDVYGNDSEAITATVTKTAGDSQPLPAPALVQLDSVTKSKIYVTFNSMIDKDSAENAGNYNINGVVISSAKVLVNDDTDQSPAVVELTLASPIEDLDISYSITIKGIKGYQGEYTQMADYKYLIDLKASLNFPYTAAASSVNGQMVITFDSDINASLSRINFAADSKAAKKFTIKETKVSGKTIIISFNETLVKGDALTIVPKMDNMVFNMNNQRMLNVPIAVTVQ